MTKHATTFSLDELVRIAAALAIVAPSGGGSEEFHLSNRIGALIAREGGKAYDEKCQALMGRYSTVVIEEWLENCCDEYPHGIADAAELIKANAGVPV